MNIQQLRYVVAIANSGTFREAAEKMYALVENIGAGHIDYPTISFLWLLLQEIE